MDASEVRKRGAIEIRLLPRALLQKHKGTQNERSHIWQLSSPRPATTLPWWGRIEMQDVRCQISRAFQSRHHEAYVVLSSQVPYLGLKGSAGLTKQVTRNMVSSRSLPKCASGLNNLQHDLEHPCIEVLYNDSGLLYSDKADQATFSFE